MIFWDFVNERAERNQRRWELRQLAKAQRIAAGITWAQRFKGLTERQAVTVATFILAGSMFKMAEVHRELWNVELFKTLLTLVVGTAIVNMILAFHFTANKSDEARGVLDAKRADNTGKMADAVIAAANATPTTSTADAAAAGAHEAADAAGDKADELERDAGPFGGPRPGGEA